MRLFLQLVVVLSCLALTAIAGAEEPSHAYFTTADEVRIHYMRLGSEGTHVVLIHGYTSSAEGNWFSNGIAQALAANHQVVALDCRNHGRSDKPQPRGGGRAADVIELMNHLGIDKAHIHGYSMGGAITGLLLASDPERFITAGFGGSGIRESDPELAAQASALDPQGSDPQEAEVLRALRIRSALDNGMSREEAEKAAANPPRRRPRRPASVATARAMRPRDPLDLTKIGIPVLAINGQFDRPYSKTQRMWRELDNFTNIVLPGKGHLTAIAGGSMPKEYLESLVAFIDANDGK